MSQDPIFKSVFAEQWDRLPPVLKTHYANRAKSYDIVTVEGVLDIEMSPILRAFSPLLKIFGLLTPYEGKQVPVTVRFLSEPNSDAFIFERVFYFPNKPPYTFRSIMRQTGPHEVVETMTMGIGWRASYHYDTDRHGVGRVVLRHKGYSLRLFGRNLNILDFLELFIGRGSAAELAIDDQSFSMQMELNSAFFDKPLYGYSGEFRVTQVKLQDLMK